MPSLISICTRRLFSKLTDFRSGVFCPVTTAIATSSTTPRSCHSGPIGYRYCHWVHHLWGTRSGFTVLACTIISLSVRVMANCLCDGYASGYTSGTAALQGGTTLSLDGGQLQTGHLDCWNTMDHPFKTAEHLQWPSKRGYFQGNIIILDSGCPLLYLSLKST